MLSQLRKLTSSISTCGQIAEVDVQAIANMGFKAIISVVPDNESPNQPLSAALAALAKSAGLEYVYFPLTGADFPLTMDLSAIREALSSAEPVLGFCRSGTRFANLWISVQEDETSRAAARAIVSSAGLDTAMSDKK